MLGKGMLLLRLGRSLAVRFREMWSCWRALVVCWVQMYRMPRGIGWQVGQMMVRRTHLKSSDGRARREHQHGL